MNNFAKGKFNESNETLNVVLFTSSYIRSTILKNKKIKKYLVSQAIFQKHESSCNLFLKKCFNPFLISRGHHKFLFLMFFLYKASLRTFYKFFNYLIINKEF